MHCGLIYQWNCMVGIMAVALQGFSWFWHLLSIALVAPTYPMNRHLADRLLRMLKHERGDVVIDWQPRIIYNLANSGLAFDRANGLNLYRCHPYC